MYRHFAVVTVLLTAGIAMFAEGENRQARAAQVASQERARPKPAVEALQPPPTRRKPRRRQQFLQETGGFDGFDASFGMPMDLASSAPSSPAGTAASDATQAGYSEAYLSSLDPEERDLLLAGLANEGVLAPRDRQRKSAALIAASQARSGASAANY
jgi:hypothetical protein